MNDTASLSARIQIDLRSGTPIYIQIMEQIKQLVIAGGLSPGDQLPTVRALAQELRINFNTVARAYRLLDEAGVISTQHGRGTYILERPPAKALERLRRESLAGLARRYLNQSLRLGASPDEIMRTLKQQIELWQATGDLSDQD